MAQDYQMAIRIPHELHELLQRSAEQSGWSGSAQVRYELLKIRGMAPQPYFPNGPSYDDTTRKQQNKIIERSKRPPANRDGV